MILRGSLMAVGVAGLMAVFLFGQDKPARLTFDVESIHPSPADEQGGGIRALTGGQAYTARNAPVKLIISLMYKVPMRQISGGPDWLNSDRWDIDAKADKPYNLDDLHTMFQNLLVDDFKLKFHIETREGPVYALLIDKTGLKMKANDKPQDYEIPVQGPPAAIVGKRVPMEYLSWWLGQQLQNDGRPVVDRTGLTGNFDFALSFTPELPPGINKDNLPPGFLDHPSIFEAVKQDLGLRMEPQKGPVPYYVIDHVEKPAAN